MSAKSRFDHVPGFDGRLRTTAHRNAMAAILRVRLQRKARRDPAAILGVLEYWLSPAVAGSIPRVDHQQP